MDFAEGVWWEWGSMTGAPASISPGAGQLVILDLHDGQKGTGRGSTEAVLASPIVSLNAGPSVCPL